MFARFGVTNICARPQAVEGRDCPTVDELAALKAMAQRHGLSLDMLEPQLLQSTHIDREEHPAIMMAQSPERDRDIEAFAETLRNAAAVGIPCVKYNMSLLGVLRTAPVQGRGDARYIAWDASKAAAGMPLTRAGRLDADAFWARITYFLKAIVPVANETKVRIACHPQDSGTPPGGYQGIDNLLCTLEGLKRFVQIEESPYHGLSFCQGTFNESFPDEGDIDMVRALQLYAEVGYDGMPMPDHVPGMDDAPVVDGKPVHTLREESFAYFYGYIRGLLQSAQRLA